MNNEDVALFRRAEQLANSGQTFAAHDMFCALRERNPEQVEVLFWVATTANDPIEARATINAIQRLQPYHPRLRELEAFHKRKSHATFTPAPVLLCPYCGIRAPARIGSKTATAGWIFFVILLIVFFPLCWIGFLFQEQYYACAHCGSRIAGR